MIGLQTRSAIPLAILACAHVALIHYISCLFRERDGFTVSSVVALCLSTLLVLYSFKYVQNLLALKFPGPIPYPFVGNGLSMISKGNIQESLRHMCCIYGPSLELILVDGSRAIIVNDAAFCKTAMKSMDRGDLEGPNDHLDNFRTNMIWIKLFSLKGLDLFSRSNTIGDWKRRRRILQPAFDQVHVRAMQKDINKCIHSLIAKLQSVSNCSIDDGNYGAFDIKPILQDFGLEVICKTSLGFHTDMIHDSQSRWMIDTMNVATSLFWEYMFDPLLWFKIKVMAPIGLFPIEIRRLEGGKRLRQFALSLLEKEKVRLAKGGSFQENLMSIILAASIEHSDNELDDESILDEVMAFLFAGHDTTSTTFSLVLHHIATHPHVQKELHDHIDGIMIDEDADYGAILQQHPFPYLSACIRESQRLQPVAPLLARRTHQDIPVPKHLIGRGSTKDTFVPKGSKVLIPCFLLHRNETMYPDPESFHPKRWIDQDGHLKPVTPGYFYAFGAGPKMCVGIQLAEKELKMTMLGILHKFQVHSVSDIIIRDTFVTGPDAVKVKLTRRGRKM